MVEKSNFPDTLIGYLESKFGSLLKKVSLSGIAGTGASRLIFDTQSVIVKGSDNPSERVFYERFADRLLHAGVNIADVWWYGQDAYGIHWIAIEDVPLEFPKDQWTDNLEQLRILFRLHTSFPTKKLPKLEDHFFRPAWDTQMTELACSWYKDRPICDEVSSLLSRAQRMSQVLFKAQCCLSGDPNPTNWRIRQDGSLVLLDWERFCYGHPAIDLAITIPGLGSHDLSVERSIARRYIQIWKSLSDELPPAEDVFAFEIRLGKLWTVVEFIARAAENPDSFPKETVAFLIRELPDLLRGLPS